MTAVTGEETMARHVIGGLVLALGLTVAGASLAQPARGAAPLPPALSALSTDVSAVLGSGHEARLLINETDHDVVSTRTVGIGEEYRDGWKVSAVSQVSVTLTKGADNRTILLSGRSQVATAPTPAGAAPATVSASNSLVSGSGRGAPGTRSPVLQAAITAGNVKQVLTMGGSAEDVAAALQAGGRFSANMDISTATFVRIGDRYGVAITAANGNRQVSTTPDFDGFLPAGPVRTVDAPPIPVGASGTFVLNAGGGVGRTAITAAPGLPPPPPIAIPAPPR